MSLLHLRLEPFLCSKKQLLFHPFLFVSYRCVSANLGTDKLHTGIQIMPTSFS